MSIRIFILFIASLSTTPLLANDFELVYVATDSQLSQWHKSREVYNKECPKCAEAWKRAWKLEGTNRDNVAFKRIRETTQRPKGEK